MAIRGDSFGSVAEVLALTRHLLAGQSTYNSTTRPTVTEVEKFIDRASGVLNVALRSVGFAPSAVYANSTSKLSCDDWVTTRAVEYVELTKPYTGFDGQPGGRTSDLADLPKMALAFAQGMALGFKREGIAVADPSHQGLAFTGLDAPSERADPDDSSLAQPLFRRGLFNNPRSFDPTRNTNEGN